jgi:CRP-like cAMP-binding protein
MRRHPELSLTIIGVLSQRLRAADERIAELAPRRPRQLHQVFDRLE